MVFQLRSQKYRVPPQYKLEPKVFYGPCDPEKKKEPAEGENVPKNVPIVPPKRLINKGAGFEQRLWKPTVRRGPIKAEISHPGPATVKLFSLVGPKVPDSKKPSGPAYSFGRITKKSYETMGPGPAQYNVTGLSNKGKNAAPAPSLHSRQAQLASFMTPSPGEYDVVDAVNTPKYSFGRLIKPLTSHQMPAPNIYKIPTVVGQSKEGPIMNPPSYSLVGRNKPVFNRVALQPGPGHYDGNYLYTKKNTPMFTMRPQTNPPRDDNKPGPGAHCPEKYFKQKSVPAPSMSIKYSQYVHQPKVFIDHSIRAVRPRKPAWCL